MTKITAAGVAIASGLVLLALAVGLWVLARGVDPDAESGSPITPEAVEVHPASETDRGFLYGRVTTLDGSTYQGRLRWGGDEEAFWGDGFNGTKEENHWIAQVPTEPRSDKDRSVKIFGVEIAGRQPEEDLSRPFMSRFGDIARIEALGNDVRVTLKSETSFDLDRFAAGDFDDGVRVWDEGQGVVDLDSLQIRRIEFLPTPSPGAGPYRLQGTVRTRQGEFTGFVQWDRRKGVGSDTLDGRTDQGRLRLPFDAIHTIACRSQESALATLLDRREYLLSDSRDVGRGNRGIYVDDPRYGRVLISWGAFEDVEFHPGGSGPAYLDFPPGRPLEGCVTSRAGARLAGRLVFDLDESETTETLDAPSDGVDYIIPFGRIASVVPSAGEQHGVLHSTVILHGGEELHLERAGDLGEGNAGMLVFAGEPGATVHLRWVDVERVDFVLPDAVDPPRCLPEGGSTVPGEH